MKKSLNYILTGLFIGLGISIALGGFVYLFDHFKLSDYDERKIELDHTKISTANSRLTTYGRIPMINTMVTNNLDILVDGIWVVVELYDKSGMYGSCNEFTDAFKPMESREILIGCSRFESDKIPKDTTFKVLISKAWSED